MSKTEKIREVVKELHLEENDVFTLKELNAISEKAEASLFEVMNFLRYER